MGLPGKWDLMVPSTLHSTEARMQAGGQLAFRLPEALVLTLSPRREAQLPLTKLVATLDLSHQMNMTLLIKKANQCSTNFTRMTESPKVLTRIGIASSPMPIPRPRSLG